MTSVSEKTNANFFTGSMLLQCGDDTLGAPLESILDQDLNALNTDNPTDTLRKNLLQQVGRIDIAAEDLEGEGTNSSFFMMSYNFLLSGTKPKIGGQAFNSA